MRTPQTTVSRATPSALPSAPPWRTILGCHEDVRAAAFAVWCQELDGVTEDEAAYWLDVEFIEPCPEERSLGNHALEQRAPTVLSDVLEHSGNRLGIPRFAQRRWYSMWAWYRWLGSTSRLLGSLLVLSPSRWWTISPGAGAGQQLLRQHTVQRADLARCLVTHLAVDLAPLHSLSLLGYCGRSLLPSAGQRRERAAATRPPARYQPTVSSGVMGKRDPG